MLPGEIEPFADHHIAKLQSIIDNIHVAHTSKTPKTLTFEEVRVMCTDLESAKNALTRFKICMADEVKQKDRYRKYAKENGYKYS